MSSFVKARLKASREAIQAKDWDGAYGCASEVLEGDAKNYNALVFKALAAANLKKDDESEKLYELAIEEQPTQQLAWQGLDKFLTERRSWTKLVALLQRQASAAVDNEDAVRCAENVQRVVAIQREEGFRSDLIQALSLYLPDSPFFQLINTLPPPDQTSPTATSTFNAQMAVHVDSLKILHEIIELTEQVERDGIEKEYEKRKNRIESMSKGRDVMRNEVGLEIWSRSKLPSLYEQVLAHVNASDEARRDAEHKLLLYRLKVLKALPNPRASSTGPGTASASTASSEVAGDARERKDSALAMVRELAEGIVAIDVADELAWQTTLEWQDCLHFTDLDRQRLRAYVFHFPRSGLSRSIEALLYVMKDQQFAAEQAEAKKQQNDVDSPRQVDPLNLALDGLELSPESLMAHRIVAMLYLNDRDWASASEIATAAITLASQMEEQIGVTLDNVRAGLDALLAVSLTHLHTPQHHPRAVRLCDTVLSRDAQNVEALMSQASIASASGKWDEARATLLAVQRHDEAHAQDEAYQVQRRMSFYGHPGRDARLEIAWCDVQLGRLDDAERELRQVIDELEADGDDHDVAKAWWRLGQCLWRMDGERRSGRGNAFTCFITSLKRDPGFASSFTSLGLYYADVCEPPDLTRASKCFQKAFELDTAEFVAARRLAEVYAEEEDWDLVDLVARRTIEAEGGSWLLENGSNDGLQVEQRRRQRRQTTQNAWAWNAIGSSELLKGNCEQAIVALQVALRSFSGEQQIWMRLGDAYLVSGRHSAAVKTYEKAQSLQSPQDQWQAAFCIAQAHRELGMYEDAVALLEQIIVDVPDLIEVRLTCAQVRLLLAHKQKQQGYARRAEDELRGCLRHAGRVLRAGSYHRAAWKVFADALLCLSDLSEPHLDEVFMQKLVTFSTHLLQPAQVDEALPAVTSVNLSAFSDASIEPTLTLKLLASFICKARIVQLTSDDETAGSSWMDLSVALYSVAEKMGSVGELDKERVKLLQSEAVSCAKEAIKLEPGNGAYWNTLGCLTGRFGVPLAQHCYVKAIECDGKDVTAWANLGVLYLAHDDSDLAHECFVRAQTLDPENGNAWIGQALVASGREDLASAASLFRHAFIIDQGTSMEGAYGFADSTLALLQSGTGVGVGQTRMCASALSSYLASRPNDVAALHIAALFAERTGDADDDDDDFNATAQWSAAADQLERAAEYLEAEYEEKETQITAQRFAVCMASLGRTYVSSGRFEEGIEKLELCLGLLEDEIGEEEQECLPRISLKRAKMGAHCCIALAHVGLGSLADAVDALTLALEDCAGGHLDEKADEIQSALLARILFQNGDAEGAKSLLIGFSESHPLSIEARRLLLVLDWLDGRRDEVHVHVEALTGKEAGAYLLALLDLYEGRVESGLQRLHHAGGESVAAQVRLAEAVVRHAVLRGPGDGEACRRARETCRALYLSIAGATQAADVTEALLTRVLQLRAVAQALEAKSLAKAQEGD